MKSWKMRSVLQLNQSESNAVEISNLLFEDRCVVTGRRQASVFVAENFKIFNIKKAINKLINKYDNQTYQWLK